MDEVGEEPVSGLIQSIAEVRPSVECIVPLVQRYVCLVVLVVVRGWVLVAEGYLYRGSTEIKRTH